MTNFISASDNVGIKDGINNAAAAAEIIDGTDSSVLDWTTEKVLEWATKNKLHWSVIDCIEREEIDGRTLISMNEIDIKDLRYKLDYSLKFGDIKKFWLALRCLQKDNYASLHKLGILDVTTAPPTITSTSTTTSSALGHHTIHSNSHPHQIYYGGNQYISASAATQAAVLASYPIGTIITGTDLLHESDRVTPPLSVDGRATNIPPEYFKTFVSLGYSFLVTWITAFVMVVVHERVPDMKRYPPLPDIFLDNVPHIPWAFHMCEITGTLLFSIWALVCIFHKHRFILLRRFFGIAGTVFLLRCVTMLITSLSVPGTHLQCSRNDYKVDDTNFTLTEAFLSRVSRAYTIWSGLGMSIQGVRTCGDYMFSGHTVALTLLNFFITEYTPRNVYFLHTMTWLLNMFGIFFILAAHEHYSIDVFVAFYITSRLFLYYHTLANNQALMSHDSGRTRVWFPMFSYFESSIDGIVPNEYDELSTIFSKLFCYIICIKDSFMLTARRIWVPTNEMTTPITNNILNKFRTDLLLEFFVTNTKKLSTEEENLINNDINNKNSSSSASTSTASYSAVKTPIMTSNLEKNSSDNLTQNQNLLNKELTPSSTSSFVSYDSHNYYHNIQPKNSPKQHQIDDHLSNKSSDSKEDANSSKSNSLRLRNNDENIKKDCISTTNLANETKSSCNIEKDEKIKKVI